MLKQPMIEKLLAMRLHGMAESLKTQEQDPAARELSFLERLGLLVDQQWNWRENQALGRRLSVGHLFHIESNELTIYCHYIDNKAPCQPSRTLQ